MNQPRLGPTFASCQKCGTVISMVACQVCRTPFAACGCNKTAKGEVIRCDVCSGRRPKAEKKKRVKNDASGYKWGSVHGKKVGE